MWSFLCFCQAFYNFVSSLNISPPCGCLRVMHYSYVFICYFLFIGCFSHVTQPGQKAEMRNKKSC